MEENKNYIGNIDFTDPVTLATIGYWTRVDNASVDWLYYMIDKNDPRLIDAIKEKYTEEVALAVTNKFYEFLSNSECGIKGKVTISTKDNSDRERGCVYNLHLDDENRDLEVILFSGDYDHMDTISFNDGKIKRTYEIMSDELSKTIDAYYYAENAEFRRYYRHYGASYEVIDGEDNLYVNIDFPYELVDKVNQNKFNKYVLKPLIFSEEQENRLKEYFTSITFPIDTERVLVDACEMTMPKGTNYHDYSEISIEVCKRTYDDSYYNYDIHEKIVIKNGEVTKKFKKPVDSNKDVKPLTTVDEKEQNRLDKIELANKYDLDLSLVDGPDQDFWDAVWDADNRLGKRNNR